MGKAVVYCAYHHQPKLRVNRVVCSLWIFKAVNSTPKIIQEEKARKYTKIIIGLKFYNLIIVIIIPKKLLFKEARARP